MKYLQFITLDRFLLIFIALIAAGLLIWNRLDIEPQLTATGLETGEMIDRGETMTTTDTYAIFEIDDSVIYLSKNTEVKIVDASQGQIDLQLIQGRIVLDGSANISIREVDITTKGQTSIVHYSWLDEIEVATMNNATSIAFADQVFTLTDSAIRMQTLPPYQSEHIQFNPEVSSEADFYKWVTDYQQ
jgi:hypothetical protein